MKLLLFVLALLVAGAVGAAEQPTSPHGSAKGAAGTPPAGVHGAPKAADVADVKVPKATGPDARTVAEVVTDRAKLKDKTVVVRGKVVKFTRAVMGKNWIHVRDGSGSAAQNTNDLVVNTKEEAKVGDVVIVKGVVKTDVDLGAGYTYQVLLENATLQK